MSSIAAKLRTRIITPSAWCHGYLSGEGAFRRAPNVFLGEEESEHDFANVEQVIFEDDFVYGFKDLHQIRSEVKPQPSQWPAVFDDAVFQSPAWQNIENAATFWKLYKKRM